MPGGQDDHRERLWLSTPLELLPVGFLLEYGVEVFEAVHG